jgi:uncharacterized membrane protein YgaE (UPF0421/DUF939 family)
MSRIASGRAVILDANLRARRRVRSALWPAGQASVAAALAWLFAHRVLGHPQPFFAPIAAAISLSISYTRRTFRIVQLVGGVLLGIAVAEVFAALLGTGTVQLGVIVFLTFSLALWVGGGFVGEGMMFANQAAASALLVVAFHRHGTGAERAVDALVGGACAFVVGVLLFPASPLPRLRRAERDVLANLAAALERVVESVRTGAAHDPGWTLRVGYEIHLSLARLAEARTTARLNVKIAPRRWGMRGLVHAEDERIERLDLLANAVLSLLRAATGEMEDERAPDADLQERLADFAECLRRLADTPQPWPPALTADVDRLARRAIEAAAARPIDRTAAVAQVLRAAARDLRAVIASDRPSSAAAGVPNGGVGGRPP